MKIQRIPFILLAAVTVVLAAATIVEKCAGTAFAHARIYNMWWFAALWAMLAASALLYIFRAKLHRHPVTLAAHLSLAVILLGALLTHCTARRGTIHLRTGEAAARFMTSDEHVAQLPFSLTLQDFRVERDKGTATAADYTSRILVTDGGETTPATVSMNHILTHRGYRFYQASYDSDERGSILSVSHDPWGIPVTYTGYALLFATLLGACLSRMRSRKATGDRPSAEHPATRRRPLPLRAATWLAVLLPALLLPALLLLTPAGQRLAALSNDNSTPDGPLPTLTRGQADRFGALFMDYNGRVAPVETFALDFTMKLCGRTSVGPYQANDILAGFLFFPDEWQRHPLIRVKSKALRERFGLPETAAYTDFFDATGNYKFLPYWDEMRATSRPTGLLRDIAEADERVELIQFLQEGRLLKLFPRRGAHNALQWEAPADESGDAAADDADAFFRANLLRYISYQLHTTGEGVDLALDKTRVYQEKNAPGALPSATRVTAERLLNRLFSPAWMARLCLLGGCLLFLAGFIPVRHRTRLPFPPRALCLGFVALAFAYLTTGLALRAVVSGRWPMGNGYETMLFMAWCIQLFGLLHSTRLLTAGPSAGAGIRLPLAATLLLSGFCLLVSGMSYMNPAITPLVPVLSSRLLTLHVSVIMMAYALLSFTAFYAVAALAGRPSASGDERACRLMHGSLRLLYPAVYLLTLGIFVGAIWANQSWGAYWSWDPKETWALITLLVYSTALHRRSLPALQRPRAYHLYVLLSFVTVLMTYFGVNYLLGGMHSYAG